MSSMGIGLVIPGMVFLSLGCFARPSGRVLSASSGIKNLALQSSYMPRKRALIKMAPETDRYLQSFGLLDARKHIPGLLVQIRYADSSNFTGKPLYLGLKRCYLHPLALKKLQKAAALLARQYPNLRILVWDCARPMHVQRLLWDAAPLPKSEKWKYLSNPNRGSLHNYGLAIDLTLADSLGVPLNMGTDYDHFGWEAHPVMEKRLRQSGILTDSVLANRRLLRSIMQAAGFNPIPHEWWHFNAVSRTTAENHFTLLP